MTEPPKIDNAVVEKIDERISEAQLPPIEPGANVPSRTTSEEDLQSLGEREAKTLKTSGQRKVNLIWETTQALIAFTITIAIIYCDIMGIKTDNLGKAFILVITMYLIRTNHTKTGGVGGTDSR